MVIVPQGWENFPKLVSGFGARGDAPEMEKPAMLKQVHGTRVIAAEEVPVDGGELEGDALTVATPGVLAAIRTADCVPILLVAPDSGWAAAVHSGWRGTVADIVGAAVSEARARGIGETELHAAIGPAIGPCCYEVGEEVAVRFDEGGLEVDRSGAKAVLDLRELNRRRLLDAGLSPQRIQICGPCTRCCSNVYCSHRANPDSGERQLSWIGWEPRRPDTDRPENP